MGSKSKHKCEYCLVELLAEINLSQQKTVFDTVGVLMIKLLLF